MLDGQELTAWDPQQGREIWRFRADSIALRKTVVSGGRVFLYVDYSTAMALDLHTGRPLWKTPAPAALRHYFDGNQAAGENLGEMLAMATPKAYVIFDPTCLQYQAFDAKDGRSLWKLSVSPKLPGYAIPACPLIWEDTIIAHGEGMNASLLSGKATAAGRNPLTRDSFPAASCGHASIVEAGLWIGSGVIDMKSGKELAPSLTKAPCGTAFFVADGVDVMYPNPCCCMGWHGMPLLRAAAPLRPQPGERLETGDVPAPAAAQSDARLAGLSRRRHAQGLFGRALPAQARIRWVYTPPRPPKGTGTAPLPGYLAADRSATQAIAVGECLWFGTAEGAIVCLDRQSGRPRWRYWTAGRIPAAPAWWQGLVYAGSADGWLYCLDAGSGKLRWRYRVAPAEHRINVMGSLSSAWPVQAILVRDGVSYAAAGVQGRLDGAAMCAVDARTGRARWTKTFRNSGETDARGMIALESPTAGGQMAWYNGKIWWQASDFGPAVVDPATGELKRALDASFLGGNGQSTSQSTAGNWRTVMGIDIGVLPGGWVAIGNDPVMGYKLGHVLLHSGPDGIPAGGRQLPQLLTLMQPCVSGTVSNTIDQQIPVWDDAEVLLYGDVGIKKIPPALYRGLPEMLNKAADARRVQGEAAQKLKAAGLWLNPGQSLVQFVTLDARPADNMQSCRRCSGTTCSKGDSRCRAPWRWPPTPWSFSATGPRRPSPCRIAGCRIRLAGGSWPSTAATARSSSTYRCLSPRCRAACRCRGPATCSCRFATAASWRSAAGPRSIR